MPNERENGVPNYTFFETDAEERKPDSRLYVVEAEYLNAERVSWQELFSGYDRLCAITYSSGLDFVFLISSIKAL